MCPIICLLIAFLDWDFFLFSKKLKFFIFKKSFRFECLRNSSLRNWTSCHRLAGCAIEKKRFSPGQKLELTPQKIFQTRIHFGGMSRTISLMKLSISTGLSNTANVAISMRYDIFRLKSQF